MRALLAAANVLEHPLNLLGQLFHARRCENFSLHAGHGDFNLDFLIVQLTFAQLFAGRVMLSSAGAAFSANPGRDGGNKASSTRSSAASSPGAHLFHRLLACI